MFEIQLHLSKFFELVSRFSSVLLLLFFIYFIFILIDLILTPKLGSFNATLENLKSKALWYSSFLVVFSFLFYFYFDTQVEGFQFLVYLNFFSFTGFSLCFGLDGISVFFIIMTTILTHCCLLVSFKFFSNIQKYIKEYIISFFFLEFLIILSFCSLDLFFFYFFFECILIPMFLIIGIWGSKSRKVRAGYYFFFYTLVSSVLMLLGIIYINITYGTTNILSLYFCDFSLSEQLVLWLLFFFAFASKIPMFPFHLWLPEAHVEAPTGGSVILAGLLLKLGGYGFLRFSIPLFPYACIYYTPLVYTLSLLGIIYASLTVLRQVDLKRIIAYSSVAHMSFVVLGLFSLTIQGLEGGLLLMLGHGVVSSALFLLVGFLYDRYHSRLLRYYGGLAMVMPVFSLFFLVFSLCNLSFPGTSNFIGELLILIGLGQVNTVALLLASVGVLLSAVYSIWLFNRLCFGSFKGIFEDVGYLAIFFRTKIRDAAYEKVSDLDCIEISILVLLTILSLLMGLYPNFFLSFFHLPVSFILKLVQFKLVGGLL